jgi:hypothetical protein
MSGRLKDAVTGVHVSNDEEVINAVHSWLRTKHRTFFFYQRNHKVVWKVVHVVRLCSNRTHFVLLCTLLRIAVVYWLTAIRSIITATALSNRSTFVNNNNTGNKVNHCGSNCMNIWEDSRTQRSESDSMLHCKYNSYPFEIYFSVLHRMLIFITHQLYFRESTINNGT